MQLTDQLCVEIVTGTYPDGAKAPSINELTVFRCINLATADRAIALLVERGILIKRRGIGIFVADGTRLHLIKERHQALVDWYVYPLIAGTATLGISGWGLIALTQREINP